jgi:hypothetical protein
MRERNRSRQMNEQTGRRGTEGVSTSQRLTEREYEALKRREETLQWLSTNAEYRLRQVWRSHKHH